MKTAFVLSGGGAKGCFQVGVMKNLIKNKGIIPDRLYGTSTGSLQASGYAHLGIDQLEQTWLAIKSQSDIMNRNWLQYLSLGLFMDGEYNLNPLRKKLEAMAALPRAPGLTCDVVVTKVSLLTGEIRYCQYDEPDFINSVLASCSVPVVNSPIDGEWVDGGVRVQTPIQEAIDDGYDRIICIVNNPPHHGIVDPWVMPKCLQIPKILIRVADDILSSQVWLGDVRKIQALQKSGANIEVYMPDVLLLNTEEYDPVKIRAAIAQGYEAQPVDLTKINL